MSIQFKEIQYKNFLSYGNNFTSFKFDQGINKFSGENGAGKSTLVDALYYCIYGKCYRNMNLSQLVNTINKKDMMVILDFQIANDNYRIERGMKPTHFLVYKNGITPEDVIPVDSKSRTYQQILEEDILGFNANLFEQVSCKSLTKAMSFFLLPKATRREIVENILDIKIYSQMNKLAKDKADALNADIKVLVKDLANLDLLIQTEQDNIKKLTLLKEELKTKSVGRVAELKLQIAELEEQNKKKEESIERIQKYKVRKLELVEQSESITNMMRTATITMNEKVDEHRKLTEDRNTTNRNTVESTIRENTSTTRQQIETLESSSNAFVSTVKSELDKKLSDLESTYNTETTAIKLRDTATIEKFTNELNDVTNKISVLKTKVTFLKETCGDCPNITKMVQDENVDELLNQKKILTASRTSVQDTSASVLQDLLLKYAATKLETKTIAEVKITENQDTLKADKKLLQDNLDITNRELSEGLAKHIKLANEKSVIEITEIKAGFEVELNKLSEENKKLKPELDQCDEYINKEKGIREQIQFNVVNIVKCQTDIVSEENGVAIEIDTEKLDTYNAKHAELTASFDEKKNLEKHYVFSRKILSEENIKAFVIKRYLSSINTLLGMYLQKFGSDVFVQFDPEWDLVSPLRHKESFTYESFSSGQQRVIDLAVLFMFIEFTKYKYPKCQTNLLILDEISAMLSAKNENIFVEIIKEISANENKSIISISHSANIDQMKVDNEYLVKIDKGFSKLEKI